MRLGLGCGGSEFGRGRLDDSFACHDSLHGQNMFVNRGVRLGLRSGAVRDLFGRESREGLVAVRAVGRPTIASPVTRLASRPKIFVDRGARGRQCVGGRLYDSRYGRKSAKRGVGLVWALAGVRVRLGRRVWGQSGRGRGSQSVDDDFASHDREVATTRRPRLRLLASTVSLALQASVADCGSQTTVFACI